jgi:hypothetical protein
VITEDEATQLIERIRAESVDHEQQGHLRRIRAGWGLDELVGWRWRLVLFTGLAGPGKTD